MDVSRTIAVKVVAAMPAPLTSFELLAPLLELGAGAPLDVDELEPLSCLALSWKAPKLFGPDSTALTEKTMPWPQ